MKKLFILLVGVGFLASCSSTKVVTDSASDIDFSQYQTVTIEYHPNKEGEHQINQLNAKRVENALHNETVARGLSNSENADLKIIWGVGVDFQKSYSTHSNYYSHGGYGYRGRYGGASFGSGYSTTQEHTTANGTFQVAVIDNETDELIWIGTARDEIKGKNKNADEKVNEIVAKVFEEFPIAKQETLASK